MKFITSLLLIIISSIYACNDNSERKVTNVESETSSNTFEMHPNELFKRNCAMCHGYNKNIIAPAITSYSVDSILNFYDGKLRKDSLWDVHKNIQLARKDWEKIARQIQPGDFFPKE
jgi:hypothetical protein